MKKLPLVDIDDRVLWLLAIAYIAQAYTFPLSAGNVFPLYIAQFSFVVFFASLYIVGAIPSGKISRQNTITIISVFAFLLLTISINQRNYTTDQESLAIMKLLGFTLTWAIFSWCACNIDIARFFRRIALCLLPLFIYIAIMFYNRSFGSRVIPFELQPNWWGELAVAFAIASAGFNETKYRLALYAVVAFVVFIVQSRSAWLAFGFIGLIEFGRLSEAKPVGMRLKFLTLIICAAFLSIAVPIIRSFIANKILLLNNPYRGLDTGFTGRVTGWLDAISVGFRSPFFGNGFSTYLFVHNGYLQVLAETGIFFFIAVCLWIIYKIASLLRNGAWIQLTAVVAPAAFIFFEPRIFNVNMDSMIFWLGMLHWNVSPIERK